MSKWAPPIEDPDGDLPENWLEIFEEIRKQVAREMRTENGTDLTGEHDG